MIRDVRVVLSRGTCPADRPRIHLFRGMTMQLYDRTIALSCPWMEAWLCHLFRVVAMRLYACCISSWVFQGKGCPFDLFIGRGERNGEEKEQEKGKGCTFDVFKGMNRVDTRSVVKDLRKTFTSVDFESKSLHSNICICRISQKWRSWHPLNSAECQTTEDVSHCRSSYKVCFCDRSNFVGVILMIGQILSSAVLVIGQVASA